MNLATTSAAHRIVGWAALAPLLLWTAACDGQPPAAARPRGTVREPAVAGPFYPREPERLRAAVRAYLDDAVLARGADPIALVVPHAAYVYSGQIAADGFAQALGRRYDLIVLLGTHHRVPDFGGVALYPGGGFRTPLGVVEVDAEAEDRLRDADPVFRLDAGPHEGEHSVEVQLPFIQVAFPGARIVPAVVGTEDPALCARAGQALAKVLAGRRALIVASSDLSHYPTYDGAVASDRAVLAAIAGLEPDRLGQAIDTQMRVGHPGLEICACGEGAVRVAMVAARALGATHGVVVSAANSGDTATGDRSRVVGYGAVMMTAGPGGADLRALDAAASTPGAGGLDDSTETRLLAFARHTLDDYLTSGTAPLARGLPPAARRSQGAFVTLREKGELRGCVGHMSEDLPLGQVVGMMTLAAALEDPRFSPVEARELPDLQIEISALTPLERVNGPDAVVIGRDGVEIRKAGRAAVFLPEVPIEEGWDRVTLMRNLCLKAGLPSDAWKSGADFYTFRSVHFRERAIHSSQP